MKTNITLKGFPMRLADDRSNIQDFAYFVGGKVTSYGDSDNQPVVQLANNHTFINPGTYATVSNDAVVKKWYADDFEEVFEVPDTIEQIPDGWEAYPDSFDFSVFGTKFVEIPEQVANRFADLLYSVKGSSFLTRKSRIGKLKSHPCYPLITEAFQRDTTADEMFDFMCEERRLEDRASGCVGRFYSGSSSDTILVSGFTAPPIEVQQYLNRRALREM